MNCVLNGLSHIALTGPDAASWLQNLITADIENQQVSTAIGAALLAPQGKILFDFIVLKNADETLILECRTDLAAALVQRLAMYKLRANLTINALAPVLIAGTDKEPGTWRDMRFSVPVWRSVTSADATNRDDYDLLRINHGVAESGFDYAVGDAFPHDINLDQIGGVGFRKGCYVGQEVVSRMQHRGTARRRMVIAKADADLPISGTPVMVGEREIGMLGTVVGTQALALIRLDKAADSDVSAMVGGVAVAFRLPLGATFELVPESESTHG